MTLDQHGDRWQGQIDLAFVQRDDQGHQYSGINDTLKMNFLRDNYEKVARSGILYRKDLQRDAKATNLRIVVRDAPTGAMGTITVPYRELILQNGQHLEMPDPARKPLRPRSN